MNHQLKQPKGRHARFAVFSAAAAVAVLCAASAAWSHSSVTGAQRPTKPLLKVTVRIRALSTGGAALNPVKVFFTPSQVNVGTYIIVARNTDDDAWHRLSINGVNSKWMGPGSGTAVMKVTFKRSGIYVAGTNTDDGETGGTGMLKVLK
jgi:hypothetical protein